MNAKLSFIAAALALSAAAANAGDLVNVPVERSSLTRAEVQAELLRARAAGEIPASSDSYGLQWAHVSTGKVPAFTMPARAESRTAAQRAPRQAVNSDYIGG